MFKIQILFCNPGEGRIADSPGAQGDRAASRRAAAELRRYLHRGAPEGRDRSEFRIGARDPLSHNFWYI